MVGFWVFNVSYICDFVNTYVNIKAKFEKKIFNII